MINTIEPHIPSRQKIESKGREAPWDFTYHPPGYINGTTSPKA